MVEADRVPEVEPEEEQRAGPAHGNPGRHAARHPQRPHQDHDRAAGQELAGRDGAPGAHGAPQRQPVAGGAGLLPLLGVASARVTFH